VRVLITPDSCPVVKFATDDTRKPVASRSVSPALALSHKVSTYNARYYQWGNMSSMYSMKSLTTGEEETAHEPCCTAIPSCKEHSWAPTAATKHLAKEWTRRETSNRLKCFITN
jgi:hypothetical protein